MIKAVNVFIAYCNNNLVKQKKDKQSNLINYEYNI